MKRMNSTQDLVFMFLDHSRLFHNMERTDTLTLRTKEKCALRFQMDGHLRHGISMPSQRPSSLKQTTDHGISPVPEGLIECKFGIQILNGSKSSNMSLRISSTPKTIRYSKSRTTKMRKAKPVLLEIEMTNPTRNGRLSILTIRKMMQPQEWMRNLDSKSINHSFWDQDSQWEEFGKLMVPVNWDKTDTPREELLSNSTSMEFLRQLDHNNGRTIA